MKNQPKLFIFELNEISPKVMNDYLAKRPNSNLVKFIKQSEIYTTVADDIPEEQLYPAQTWASINSGVSYKKHQIKWYNDSKDKAPQIWDELSKKISSGLINVVHSSSYKNIDLFNYFISDPYEKNNLTIPNSLTGFQRFKNKQTFKSGRVSKFSLSARDVLDIFSFFL